MARGRDAPQDAPRFEHIVAGESTALAENGVGYAIDENNRALITPEMEAQLEDAKAKIIAGELVVEPYLVE